MGRFLKRTNVRDTFLIVLGCLVFALGIDMFEIPNGIAAGGATGLATVLAAVARPYGITLPVGLQVIAMNVVLLALVFRTGGLRYAYRTIVGVFASSIFVDVLAPVLPVLGSGDLLLCALWGGVITGLGLGLVFRVGGNTGGTDILAQLLSKRLPFSNGATMFVVDALVVAVSIPVFGLENALYAVVAMYISGYEIDLGVAGMNARRAAYIVSDKWRELKPLILTDLDRGCTELLARGAYTGEERPVLMVVLSRSETAELKALVSQVDPNAIVFISDVHEAFGQGFGSLKAQ